MDAYFYDSLCKPGANPPWHCYIRSYVQRVTFDVDDNPQCSKESTDYDDRVNIGPLSPAAWVQINFTMNYTFDVNLLDVVLLQLETVASSTIFPPPTPPNVAVPTYSILRHAAGTDVPDGQLTANLFMRLNYATGEDASSVGIIQANPPLGCWLITSQTDLDVVNTT